MTKLIKGIAITGSTIVAMGAGAGIAAGVIVPKAIKAKEALSSFIPDGGSNPMLKWDSSKKVNYVALGDSESAGYEYVGLEGVKYSDYLANDLKKSSHLGNYNNFAKSGATLAEQHEMVLESISVQEKLKDSDLITLTLGANDLLKFVNMFGSPMGSD